MKTRTNPRLLYKENTSTPKEIEQDKKVRCLHKANMVAYAYRPHADLEDQTRETVIPDMHTLHRYLPLSSWFASLSSNSQRHGKKDARQPRLTSDGEFIGVKRLIRCRHFATSLKDCIQPTVIPTCLIFPLLRYSASLVCGNVEEGMTRRSTM